MHKIVHIARPIAGVGVYINLLVNHINDQKFENILICNKEEKNFKINNRYQQSIPQFQVKLLRKINLINDLKCLFEIIGLLKKINPDIIHCHSAKAGFLGRVAGAYLKIPTVYTPHAFSYLSSENKFKRIIFKGVEKWLRLLPSKTLACSTSEYNRAIEDLKFKKDKLYLWKNSIKDIVDIKPSKLIDNLPDKFICSIGRPSYQKNIEMQIEVMELLKKRGTNIHLVLLGIGLYAPTLNKIKKLIKNKKLTKNITLVPWLEREETMSILKASKFYISSSRYEGLPYSVIEALSLAKPCVVTDVEGNRDLIKDNHNGFLVDVGNAKSMAEKISLISNDEKMLKTMSENSRKEYLNNYNIGKNITALEKIYISEIG